jgi:O-acetylserine/cysteine efflux transporter
MPPFHILLVILIQICWGATYPLCKPYVEVFPPMALVAMVYTFVALISAPMYLRPKTPQRTLFLLGFFGGALQTGMVFVALKYLPASTAVLAMQAQLPIGVVASWFMGRDKPSVKNSLGSVVCLIGIVIVVGKPEATDAWFGLAAMLLGVASWSVAQAAIPVVAKDQGMMLYAGMTRYAAPQMLVMSLIFEHGQLHTLADVPLSAWGAVPIIALAGFAVPYAIWYWLLMRHRVDELLPFVILMPIVSIVVTTTLLGEKLPPALLLGGAIVIAGLAVIVFKRRAGRAIGDTPAQN